MSIFRWTAPVFKLVARRWSRADLRVVADWLRPYVPPGGTLADLGGGTGDIGAAVGQVLDAQVVVIDETPQMLWRVDAHPHVTVRLATAQALPFPDAHFDAVLCCDAFHHFDDQDAAATEMARVVRPGGGVIVLDAEPTPHNRWLSVVERCLGEPGGFKTIPEMETFMASHGIAGACTRLGKTSYVFNGSVRRSP